MSQIVQRIDSLGRREAATLATATTQRVFATLSGPVPGFRQAVNLANCDASADLLVTLAMAGGSAPSLSASDFDLLIPPKTSRQVVVGPSIDLWVRSTSAGSIAYTASELL